MQCFIPLLFILVCIVLHFYWRNAVTVWQYVSFITIVLAFLLLLAHVENMYMLLALQFLFNNQFCIYCMWSCVLKFYTRDVMHMHTAYFIEWKRSRHSLQIVCKVKWDNVHVLEPFVAVISWYDYYTSTATVLSW